MEHWTTKEVAIQKENPTSLTDEASIVAELYMDVMKRIQNLVQHMINKTARKRGSVH